MHHFMKSVTLLITFFSAVCSFGQDARLLENTWYLYDLVIDGQSNTPPVNSEIPYVAADFTVDQIETGMCASPGVGFIFYQGQSQFTIPNGFIWLLGGCQNYPINQTYLNQYIIFWDETATDSVDYEISENGSERTLIVTNIESDQAIYSNQILSDHTNFSESFKVHPNPTDNVIRITNLDGVNILSISLLNLLGEQISKYNPESETLNFSNLSAGIYFLSIKHDRSQSSTIIRVLKK